MEAPQDGLHELLVSGLKADNVKFLVYGLNNGNAQKVATLEEVKSHIESTYNGVTFNSKAIKVEDDKILIDGSVLSTSDWNKVKANGDKTVPYRITVLLNDKATKVAKIAIYQDGVAVIEKLH
ncbi:hypothetical protein [Bacillus testis]|uniref:hypothetical protein n=1 Tax=Bacillus testis TaxID=1622072 RepID=UPI00067EDDBC|nr:hypothetical protein [Bacillus testis]